MVQAADAFRVTTDPFYERLEVSVPLRCPRHGCGGQLYLDPFDTDVAGVMLFDVKCFSCGRSSRVLDAHVVARNFGVPLRDFEQAHYASLKFLWRPSGARRD